MKRVKLLDCTLRDGGYLNDWNFGEQAIKGTARKLAQTGVEFFEIGFIKEEPFNKDRSVFPSVQSIVPFISPKSNNMLYVGMIDCKCPVPLEHIVPYDGTSVDAIRVIFKKDKIDFAFKYCAGLQEKGYRVFVQFVGTDSYSDTEFVQAIERFNHLYPYAMSIVDTFGTIKRKDFLRLAYLADNNMEKGILLGYHGHNNLQQALGNAETLVELNLSRDVCIDACVFGMGRGAGNLNLELFAGYMNDNYDCDYKIEPMLEIMDDYLQEIYSRRFWGYCLPYYLSALHGCHPNYAIYFAEKHTLAEKSFNELLKSLPQDIKRNYKKSDAEEYYQRYLSQYIDDRADSEALRKIFNAKSVLILAPGMSLDREREKISALIKNENPLVVAVNFLPEDYAVDYLFSSNMHRYSKLQQQDGVKRIITSNMKEADLFDYKLNFATYAVPEPDLLDNSGLVFLQFLCTTNVKHVYIAGMDGYTLDDNYFDPGRKHDLEYILMRNQQIQAQLSRLAKNCPISLVTASLYTIG